ncbi:inositol monophosphatase [bacterium]|nr:inositol monophosphatase [bacterium]
MSSYNTDAVLAAIVEASSITGQRLAEMQARLDYSAVVSKTSAVDLASSADNEAEAMLRDSLGRIAPEAGFVGEESFDSAAWQAGPRTALAWVVDPLDGTSNFLCGLPLWSVSVALCEVDAAGRLAPLLGVIAAPLLSRLWQGRRGAGAWLNGRRLSVRSEPPGGGMHNAMLATGFPYDVAEGHQYSNIEQYSRMQRRFQKIRRLGSAAIDCAFVAEGVYDGMWEFKLKPWDVCAGLLLMDEAGAHTCRLDGSAYTPGDIDMVTAATPELLEKMLKVLNGT